MPVIEMDRALLERRGDAAWIQHFERLAGRPFIGGTTIRAPRYDDRHLLALREGDQAALAASGLPAPWPPRPRAERPQRASA